MKLISMRNLGDGCTARECYIKIISVICGGDKNIVQFKTDFQMKFDRVWCIMIVFLIWLNSVGHIFMYTLRYVQHMTTVVSFIACVKLHDK